MDASEDDCHEDEAMLERPTASEDQESKHVHQSEQVSVMACCHSEQEICKQVCDLKPIVSCVDIQLLGGDCGASGKASGMVCRCGNFLGTIIMTSIMGASFYTSGVCVMPSKKQAELDKEERQPATG